MVIVAKDFGGACYSASDGIELLSELEREMEKNEVVELSFYGVSEATSSFINNSIVPLLDSYTLAWVKEKLIITNATKQIADMIRRCMAVSLRDTGGNPV